jgi:uncharacterized protein YebE (UPF0316 family)
VAWYIPLLIFCARITDVSIGTVRMILVISGVKYVAAVLGFVEVLIWALAVGGVIKYLGEPIALIAYGSGFATGTLIGMTIEDRIAIGHRIIRIINPKPDIDVSAMLRDREYRVTRIEGSGMHGPVEVAFLIVRRRIVPAVLDLVRDLAPDAFVTIERADPASVVQSGPNRRVARWSLGKFGGIRK